MNEVGAYAYQIWMCSICDWEPEPINNNEMACAKCGRVYDKHDGGLIRDEGLPQ